MTEVLSHPASTSSNPLQQDPPRATSPPAEALPRARPPPRDRHAPPPHQNQPHSTPQQQPQPRISTSPIRASRSRPQSLSVDASAPGFPNALVRDFAYPGYNPMHYGAPPDPPSDPTTPSSAAAANTTSADSWSSGSWTGDSELSGDPHSAEQEHLAQVQRIEPLPSTSFGHEIGSRSGEESAISHLWLAQHEQDQGRRKHRKSKSIADISSYERGRRRRDSGRRRSSRRGEEEGEGEEREEEDGAEDSELFALTDTAGRTDLRQSPATTTIPTTAASALPTGDTHNGPRRDSHIVAAAAATMPPTLPTRSFHPPPTILSASPAPLDPDDAMPLDAEPRTSPPTSPHRQSIGPEDEDLFAGPSLALYSFEPENANELRLREMQVIMVSYRHGQGWLVAEDMQTGEQGLVPEEYVRLLEDIPGYDAGSGTFVGGDEDGEEGHEEEESLEEEVHEERADAEKRGTAGEIVENRVATKRTHLDDEENAEVRGDGEEGEEQHA